MYESNLIGINGISFGSSIAAWENVISVFSSGKTNNDNQESESNISAQLTIRNASVYYQPTLRNNFTQGIFIVPPRALISANIIKVITGRFTCR